MPQDKYTLLETLYEKTLRRSVLALIFPKKPKHTWRNNDRRGCGKCRYFHGPFTGVCLRHAPIGTLPYDGGPLRSEWPAAKDDGSCGDWEKERRK